MDINGKVVVSYRWAENEHYVLAVKQGTLVVKVRRHAVLSWEFIVTIFLVTSRADLAAFLDFSFCIYFQHPVSSKC